MKKLFIMLIILFITYLGIQFAFNYFGKGQAEEYEIEKNNITFKIKETSTFNVKDIVDNYYYNITINNKNFIFQTYYDFNKQHNNIKDIYYYKKDNYECLLPIFKDKKILMDLMCYYKDDLTYYYNIKGQNKELDAFVNNIKEYDVTNFTPNKDLETIEKINIYRNNLIKDHYIGITNYRGIYNISNNFNSVVYKIDLFKKDIYNQKVGIYNDNYYLVADYNNQYEFNKFNVVNLQKLDTTTIISNNEISLDSYIQGVVDNKIYLFDKDKKKQYEINIKTSLVTEIGSDNNLKYYDGSWNKMTLEQAMNELKFINVKKDYENNKYARIDKIGEQTGYYYLYEKVNDGYKVYKMNIQDKKDITYLFTTKNIDNIYYIENYVYFISGDTIYVYNDTFGVKPLVQYKELEFNKNINFNVFIK